MDPLTALGVGGAVANTAVGVANLGQQRKHFDYQKKLQKKVFKREDTAMQRRVRDLEKAGLHRSLAAGAGSSAGAIAPTKAPQMNANTSEVAQSTMAGKLFKEQLQGQKILNSVNAQELVNKKHNLTVAQQKQLPVGSAGDNKMQIIDRLIKNSNALPHSTDSKEDIKKKNNFWLKTLGIQTQ